MQFTGYRNPNLPTELNTPVGSNELEIMITDIIHQIGVPAHIKGYHYLREAIVLSVNNPDIINSSRKKRIAKGSGTSVEEVNKLLKQFDQMKKLMKQMSSGKFKGFGFGRKMKMPF